MSNPRITYLPHPDATRESELSVLASVYAYLIKTHDSKEVAEPAQLQNWRGEEFDTKEGGRDDVETNAIHGA
jgi:hypothetical protein